MFWTPAKFKGLCPVPEIQELIKYGSLSIWGRRSKADQWQVKDENTGSEGICLSKGTERWKSQTHLRPAIESKKGSPRVTM